MENWKNDKFLKTKPHTLDQEEIMRETKNSKS